MTSERAATERSSSRLPGASATHAVSTYEFLQAAIIGGELAPGEVLREASVAEWCGVSRTPVREALLRLEQDRFVMRTQHGMIVRPRTIEEILDIYDTRLLLEPAAARFAAERRTDVDLWQMKLALQAVEKVAPDADSELVAANMRFHAAVWQAAHSHSLVELLERLNLHWRRYPETTLNSRNRRSRALSEHRALVEAIENRDGEEAFALSEGHIRAARDVRLALLADS